LALLFGLFPSLKFICTLNVPEFPLLLSLDLLFPQSLSQESQPFVVAAVVTGLFDAFVLLFHPLTTGTFDVIVDGFGDGDIFLAGSKSSPQLSHPLFPFPFAVLVFAFVVMGPVVVLDIPLPPFGTGMLDFPPQTLAVFRTFFSSPPIRSSQLSICQGLFGFFGSFIPPPLPPPLPPLPTPLEESFTPIPFEVAADPAPNDETVVGCNTFALGNDAAIDEEDPVFDPKDSRVVVLLFPFAFMFRFILLPPVVCPNEDGTFGSSVPTIFLTALPAKADTADPAQLPHPSVLLLLFEFAFALAFADENEVGVAC
jgi:hypothetical protein